MSRLALLPGLLVAGCGGAHFDFQAGFKPDAPSQIEDGLQPLDLTFTDGFFVTEELDGEPMVGLLASTFSDPCSRYAAYLPVADNDYNKMLDLYGADEQTVVDDWQASLDENFPDEGAVFFLAMGTKSLGTDDIEITAKEVLDMATTTFDQEEAAQPAGTFVADLFYRTSELSIGCIYGDACDDNAAAQLAYQNYYGANGGTVTVSSYNPDKRLKGDLSVDLVSRELDDPDNFGTPATLGSAMATFSLPFCADVDEKIFRFYSFL